MDLILVAMADEIVAKDAMFISKRAACFSEVENTWCASLVLRKLGLHQFQSAICTGNSSNMSMNLYRHLQETSL